MAKYKHDKYIITKTKSDLKLPDFRREALITAGDTRTAMAYLDGEVLKGAFYVECVWFWKSMAKPEVEAHTHDFDEVITFFGTNPKDPEDLCGEVELWLEDEKLTLTKSCLIFVPKGMKHCPLHIKRVDRPIFHYTAGPAKSYK
ncbi:MAG: hypothetical protein NT134_01685 [Chloroflexi bacterium]|nr:hypothetical protein [Chloroflexota bacterium]